MQGMSLGAKSTTNGRWLIADNFMQNWDCVRLPKPAYPAFQLEEAHRNDFVLVRVFVCLSRPLPTSHPPTGIAAAVYHGACFPGASSSAAIDIHYRFYFFLFIPRPCSGSSQNHQAR